MQTLTPTRVRIHAPGAWYNGYTGRVTAQDSVGASVLLADGRTVLASHKSIRALP